MILDTCKEQYLEPGKSVDQATADFNKERESGKQLFAALRGWGRLAKEKGLQLGKQIPLGLIQAGRTKYNDFLSDTPESTFAQDGRGILAGAHEIILTQSYGEKPPLYVIASNPNPSDTEIQTPDKRELLGNHRYRSSILFYTGTWHRFIRPWTIYGKSNSP